MTYKGDEFLVFVYLIIYTGIHQTIPWRGENCCLLRKELDETPIECLKTLLLSHKTVHSFLDWSLDILRGKR